MATGSTVKPVLWATSRGQANGQAGRLRVGQDELLTLDMLAVLSGKAQPSLGAASDPPTYARKASDAAATPSGQGTAAGTAAAQGSGRPTSARSAGGLSGGNKSQVVSKSGRPISASLLVQSSKTSAAPHMRPGSAPVTPTKAGAAGAGVGAGAAATDAATASAKKASGAGGTGLLPRTGGAAPAGSLASRTAPSPTSTSGRGFSPAPESGTAAAAFKAGSGASTGPATAKGQGGGGLRRPLSAGTIGASSGIGAAAAAGSSLYSTTPAPGSRAGAGAGAGMRRTLSAGHVQPGSRPLSARTRTNNPGVGAGSKPGSNSKPEPPLLGRLFEHVNTSRPRPATPSLTADPPQLSELRRSHSLTSSSPAPAQGPSAPQAPGADGTASLPAMPAHVETPSASSAARGGEPTGAGLSPAAASVMHAFHTRGAAAGSGMNAIKMAVANAQQHLASSLLATSSGVPSTSGGQVGTGAGAGGAGGAGAAGQDLRGTGAAGTAGESDGQARGVGGTDQGSGLKLAAQQQLGSDDGRGRDGVGPAAAATMLAALPAPLTAAAAAAGATPTEAALLQPAVTKGIGAAPSTNAASSAMPSPGVTVTGSSGGSTEAASAATAGASRTAAATEAGMAAASAAETTEITTKSEASEVEAVATAAAAAEVPAVAPAPAASGSNDAHETLQAAKSRPDGRTLGVTVPTPSCSSSAAPSPKAEKSGESVGTPTGQRHSPDNYRLLTVNIPDAGEAGVISQAATKQRPVHTGPSYAQRHQQQQQQQRRTQHDVHGPQAQPMVTGMAAQVPGSSLSPAPPLPGGLPDPSTQTLHDLLVESAELSEVWGVDAGWLARVLGQGGVGPRA